MMGLRNVASMRVDDDAAACTTDFGGAPRPEWVGRTLVDAEGHRWHELDLAALAGGGDFLLVGR
jgi:hypothetical protein